MDKPGLIHALAETFLKTFLKTFCSCLTFAPATYILDEHLSHFELSSIQLAEEESILL